MSALDACIAIFGLCSLCFACLPCSKKSVKEDEELDEKYTSKNNKCSTWTGTICILRAAPTSARDDYFDCIICAITRGRPKYDNLQNCIGGHRTISRIYDAFGNTIALTLQIHVVAIELRRFIDYVVNIPWIRRAIAPQVCLKQSGYKPLVIKANLKPSNFV
ncbi:hypothetical protein OBBRIDRAFT_803473 [Obba rivulosa]|uniref:Secreted protein n=1 Tax=Obba rivulosa TaxID=1052685 RepID=A0A8E2AZN6_9APHY|nr:hypothetical protein OBBRIDRAFT_803473 [Obba rivulosa]